MKRILQAVGIVLLFSPILALMLRIGSDLPQPDGVSQAVGLLFKSRMVLIFGWSPFFVGVILFCMATYIIKQPNQQNS